MDTSMSQRSEWEKKAAKKYGIDREINRDFFEQVWETRGVGSLEDFDACVETAWPFYVRGKETTDSYAHGMVSGGESAQSQKQGGSQPPEPIAGMNERTGARIGAVSEYLAKIAACNKRVMHLRECICGGVTRTISHEEALRFLEARSTKGDKVIIDAPDTLPWPAPEPDGSVSGRYFRVQEDSVLEKLLDAAKYLERHYPWSVDQAANFILCGVVPKAGIILGKWKRSSGGDSSVAAHKFNRATITLEVDSWVSADEVRTAYLHMRRRVHSADSGGFPPPRLHKHPTPRNLDVFRFVVDQSKIRVINSRERLGRLELPPWRDLMERWNNSLRAADDPRRYSNYKNFQRDFRRAQSAVIGTNHGLPGVPGMPMSAAEVKAGSRLFVERLRRQVRGDDDESHE